MTAGRAAFTLLEVLLAVTLLGVLMVAAVGLVRDALRGSAAVQRAQHEHFARRAAIALMRDDLRGGGAFELVDERSLVVHTSHGIGDGARFAVRWRFTEMGELTRSERPLEPAEVQPTPEAASPSARVVWRGVAGARFAVDENGALQWTISDASPALAEAGDEADWLVWAATW